MYNYNLRTKEQSVVNKFINEYQQYVAKTGNRIDLYRLIASKYNIKTALYPGSHIDIDPSLIISKVTYIDNFKGAIKFFKNTEGIREYLDKNKEYPSLCKFDFIAEDYTKPLKVAKVDLIISQYAGFVGQATKKLLKSGGILLCNDSHGDATLAQFDDDYELIGVVESNKILINKLDEYFKLPKDKLVDLNVVRKKMKGLKYIKNADNYIFKKLI
jgi:hypothetical protein